MKLKTKLTYSFGFPDKLIITDEKENFICSFYYNMKGFNPNFTLKNNDGVGYGFLERSEKTQVSELKKALKSGYTNFKHY